jgi:hypothetical protein
MHILSRIDVTIMDGPTCGAGPLTDIQRKGVEKMPTIGTAFRGGKPAVNLDQMAPIPRSFILQLRHELTPPNVRDRLGKRVILDHVFHRKRLHTDRLVFTDQTCRELVQKITASLSNPGMDTSHLLGRFGTVLGTFFLLGVVSLSLRQFLFVFGEVFGVAHFLASRKDHEVFQAQIRPNGLLDRFERWDILFYQDGYEIPISSVFGDGNSAWFAAFGQTPVQAHIQRRDHFGQGEPFPIPLERVGSIGSRLVALLLLEGGILDSTLKEMDKGPIQVPKGLLNGHAGNSREPRVLFLESRQQGSEVIVVQLLSELVGSRAGMQAPIVDEADTSERLSKNPLLLISRIEPEFVCSLLGTHDLLRAFLLPLEMFLYRRQALSIERPIMLFRCFSSLFQHMGRKPDSERFHSVFHVTILLFTWFHVKWHGATRPYPKKGTPLVSP